VIPVAIMVVAISLVMLVPIPTIMVVVVSSIYYIIKTTNNQWSRLARKNHGKTTAKINFLTSGRSRSPSRHIQCSSPTRSTICPPTRLGKSS
jgi:hypothetical protein